MLPRSRHECFLWVGLNRPEILQTPQPALPLVAEEDLRLRLGLRGRRPHVDVGQSGRLLVEELPERPANMRHRTKSSRNHTRKQRNGTNLPVEADLPDDALVQPLHLE